MKFESNIKREFVPITLTLETEQEAIELAALFRYAFCNARDGSALERAAVKFKDPMYYQLHNQNVERWDERVNNLREDA